MSHITDSKSIVQSPPAPESFYSTSGSLLGFRRDAAYWETEIQCVETMWSWRSLTPRFRCLFLNHFPF
jgi:hypothetical protein